MYIDDYTYSLLKIIELVQMDYFSITSWWYIITIMCMIHHITTTISASYISYDPSWNFDGYDDTLYYKFTYVLQSILIMLTYLFACLLMCFSSTSIVGWIVFLINTEYMYSAKENWSKTDEQNAITMYTIAALMSTLYCNNWMMGVITVLMIHWSIASYMKYSYTAHIYTYLFLNIIYKAAPILLDTELLQQFNILFESGIIIFSATLGLSAMIYVSNKYRDKLSYKHLISKVLITTSSLQLLSNDNIYSNLIGCFFVGKTIDDIYKCDIIE